MSLPILMLLLRDLPKHQRVQVAEQLLPLALPGAAAQGMAIAITAERQAKRQAKLEERLVEEAIAAGSIRTPDALASFPTLNAAFSRLPQATRARLIPPGVAPPPGGGVRSPGAFASGFNPGSGAPSPGGGGPSAPSPAPTPVPSPEP